MMKAHQRGSFMGCSITAADSSQMEAVLNNGLIKGHAYSITSIKLVQINHPKMQVQGKIPLIRIRNPWGNEAEWKGAWSDQYVFLFRFVNGIRYIKSNSINVL